jgi:RTX calcium-binding nonapeptide repeat (4 copies)
MRSRALLGRSKAKALAAGTAVAALIAGSAVLGSAAVVPGTSGNDVHFGRDNDNANNTFIQPPGVAAKQHMDNTDVLFGRAGADLLIGKLGDDTILGGPALDILIGGPEGGQTPNSDVLIGDAGDDINIWAPGDGSEVFVGERGHDTMVFAPFVTNDDGSLRLVRRDGRRVPRVDIGGQPTFSCQIVPVPPSQNLGEQFLIRFLVNDTIVVTVRQKDVERVLCPAANEGWAKRANLTAAHPRFQRVRLSNIDGVLGAIVAPPA